MSEIGKYRTAHSLEEVLEIFRLGGMSPEQIEEFRDRLTAAGPEPPPKPELNGVDEIYERTCSVCAGPCFVTAAMQALCPPDSPFNVCNGCLNRFAVQDEETTLGEVERIFTDEWWGEWRNGI